MLFYCIVFIVTFTFCVIYYGSHEAHHPMYQDALDTSYYNLLSALILSLFVPNPQKYDISFLSIQNFTSVFLYAVISHIIFYVAHRTLHTKEFYKAFHKRHHRWNNVVISPSTFDCHVVEFWMCNMASFAIPLHLPLTNFTRVLLVIFATISAVSSHQISNQDEHKKHHQFVRCNYGIGPFYWLDIMCGTHMH